MSESNDRAKIALQTEAIMESEPQSKFTPSIVSQFSSSPIEYLERKGESALL